MINTVFLGEPGGLTQDSRDPLVNLQAEFDRPRENKNAVTLAHFYQDSEIQGVVNRVGDTLVLSRKKAETESDIIAFCGARFMALSSMEKLCLALANEAPYIEMPEKLCRRALTPMQRMLNF